MVSSTVYNKKHSNTGRLYKQKKNENQKKVRQQKKKESQQKIKDSRDFKYEDTRPYEQRNFEKYGREYYTNFE